MKKFIVVMLVLLTIGLSFYAYLKTNYIIAAGDASEATRASNMALEQNNPLLCGKIIILFQILPGESQEGLRKECYFATAQKLNNSDICDHITDNNYPDQGYKDICITNIAVSTKNANLCEKLSEQFDKDYCYRETKSFAK